MKAYILTLSCVLVAVITLNLGVDRSGLGNYAISYRLSARQLPNEVLVSDKAIDQRAVLMQRLVADTAIDLLVLGSSTVGGIRSDLLGERAFYNGWLSEMMPEDLEAITALIEQRRTPPKAIILGIDAWFFNDKVHNDRWTSISDARAEFLNRNRRIARLIDGARTGWQHFRELLSFETTRATIEYLQARRAHSGEATSVWLANGDLEATCPGATNELQIRYYDGHFVGCSQFLLSGDRLRQTAGSYVQRDFHLMRSWRGISSARFDRLEAVVAAWRQLGIRVVLLVPPYHPDTYAELMRNNSIANNLSELDRRLDALCTRRGVVLVNLRNPATAGCGPDEFTDSHHQAPSCLAKVAAILRDHSLISGRQRHQ